MNVIKVVEDAQGDSSLSCFSNDTPQNAPGSFWTISLLRVSSFYWMQNMFL
jgi:hypothetical protein